MKKLMIVVAMLVLTACATRGQKFEMTDVESFQPGVTTDVPPESPRTAATRAGRSGSRMALMALRRPGAASG